MKMTVFLLKYKVLDNGRIAELNRNKETEIFLTFIKIS